MTLIAVIKILNIKTARLYDCSIKKIFVASLSRTEESYNFYIFYSNLVTLSNLIGAKNWGYPTPKIGLFSVSLFVILKESKKLKT